MGQMLSSRVLVPAAVFLRCRALRVGLRREEDVQIDLLLRSADLLDVILPVGPTRRLQQSPTRPASEAFRVPSFSVRVRRGAHLTGADLRRAWLREPESMEKADLRRAKLLETRIVDADFDGVDLEGAYLEGAYLVGADLSGAINLEYARLANASYDAAVSWPEGFDAEAAGAKPIREDRNDPLRRLGEEKVVSYVDTDGTPQPR